MNVNGVVYISALSWNICQYCCHKQSWNTAKIRKLVSSVWQFLEVLPATSLNVCCYYVVFVCAVQNVWLEAKYCSMPNKTNLIPISCTDWNDSDILHYTLEWKYLTDKILTFDWDSLFRLLTLFRNAAPAITAQNSKCVNTVTVFSKCLKPLTQEVLLIEGQSSSLLVCERRISF